MIENYSYGLNSQIGKGFSSKVFKGQNELNGETVAVKVFFKFYNLGYRQNTPKNSLTSCVIAIRN